MKAIIYQKYGGPEVLSINEVNKPSPLNSEILIRVHAAEATKSDCEMRNFSFAVKWFWLPLRLALGIMKPKRQILGAYFSGQVEFVGEDVTKFTEGDHVFGSSQLRFGGYGQYICLPENYTVVPKPSNLSHLEAAAVPFGGLTALHYLRLAKIQSGEKVLINGAGASIGTFAVQIAKSMGAEVTAVDTGIKEQMLRDVGADHFIDYTKQSFTKNGQTYDMILDMVASSSYGASIRSLKPAGRYLMANPRLIDMLRSLFTPRLSDKKVFFAFATETEEQLLELKAMIEAGKISPVVDKVFAMQDVAEAHERVETEQRLGCVVISLAN